MKRTLQSTIALSLATVLAFPTLSGAASNIERSNITEVVKDVSIMELATKKKKTARVSEVFGVPDIMRTGRDSRAEMIADDETVTRIGADTLFSFEPQKREINLQRGSVLFNSPTGKGGGNIRTAAATAAVQGTTLIVVTTKNGGFKVLLMEGRGRVKSGNGQSRSLRAGQMVYALPGGALSGVLTFQLGEQVAASRLINGFKKKLPSMAKIEAAIATQAREIARGQLVTTGLLAGDLPDLAYQVNVNPREVLLRPTVVEEAIDPLATALATDATIPQPNLDSARIFTIDPTTRALLPQAGGNGFMFPSEFTLFGALNTTVLTETIDLAPYPGSFVFLSLGDFIVEQGVSINGANGPVAIVAGGTIQQAPGTFISIDAADAFVFSLGTAAPGGVTLALSDGGIAAFGNLTVFAPDMDLQLSNLHSQTGDLTVNSSKNLNAAGFGIAFPQFAANGTIAIDAANDIVAANSFSVAQQVRITAGNDMTLSAVAFAGNGVPIAQAVNLTAGNLMTLTNVAFQAQSVALDARTLALTNVDFIAGSKITLRSQTGLLAPNPNTNRPVQPGMVNFIRNVNHGGMPAQNAVAGGSITLTK